MNGIANYIEKTSDEFDNNEPVTQNDVDQIVNGIAGNDFVFSMIADGEDTPTIIEIEDEGHKAMFESAISNSSLSDENKEAMRIMFGLNA